jgi:DNA-binding beta-propeller fold protein YncE
VLNPTFDSKKLEDFGQIVASIPYTDAFQEPVAGLGAVWLPNFQAGLLTRIDIATNKIAAKIKVGEPFSTKGDPPAVTIVGEQVWVASDANHEVLRIDPGTNEIVEHISLGTFSISNSSWPIDPAGLTSDGDDLWVTDFNDSLVLRIDLKTKQVVAMIKNVDHPIGIVAGAGAVWVVLHRKDAVVRIDPETNTIIAKIALGGPGNNATCSLCLSQMVFAEGNLWVALHDGNGVARVDPTTNQMTKIDLGMFTIDVAAGMGSIWAVGGPDVPDCTGYVARIDPKTNAAIRKQSIDCVNTITVADKALWISNNDSIMRIQPNP